MIVPQVSAGPEPPLPPMLVQATEAAEGIVLTWQPPLDASNVVGYRVYREDVLLATVPTTSYVDGGGDATNVYSVASVDAEGQASLPVTATTTPKCFSVDLATPPFVFLALDDCVPDIPGYVENVVRTLNEPPILDHG